MPVNWANKQRCLSHAQTATVLYRWQWTVRAAESHAHANARTHMLSCTRLSVRLLALLWGCGNWCRYHYFRALVNPSSLATLVLSRTKQIYNVDTGVGSVEMTVKVLWCQVTCGRKIASVCLVQCYPSMILDTVWFDIRDEHLNVVSDDVLFWWISDRKRRTGVPGMEEEATVSTGMTLVGGMKGQVNM